MTLVDCAELADAAPELALGVLTGRERAEALEHLDGCSSCRQLVNSLSGVTDELLRSFAPSIEPSAGFEARVLAAMTTPSPVSSLRPRRLRMAAGLAVAACIALIVGLVVSLGPSAKPTVASAAMRTSSGETVGWVYVDHNEPASVSLSLPGWSGQVDRYGRAATSYSLHLTTATGTDRVLPVSLDGQAAWTGTVDVDPDAITGAALVDDSGHVWCHADLTAT